MSDGNGIAAIRIRHHHWPLDDATDGLDGNLGLVDDGQAEDVAKDTRIRDGEGATGNFVRDEFLGAGTLRQVIQ